MDMLSLVYTISAVVGGGFCVKPHQNPGKNGSQIYSVLLIGN